MHEDLMNEGLLTVKDAAAFLAVSRATVWKLMLSGDLVYSYIGHGRRIPRAALKALALKGLTSGRVAVE